MTTINIIDENTLEVVEESKTVHNKEQLLLRKQKLEEKLAEITQLLSNFE